MKRGSKWLSIMLALCLIGSLAAGCGNNPANIPTSGSETAAVSSVENAEPPAPVETATPAEPASEQEAVPTAEEEDWLPLCEEIETLSYWHTYGANTFNEITSFDEHLGYQTVEEMTNVHIEHVAVSSNQETEQFNIMVAAGDWPDMIQNFGGLYTTKAIGGYTDNVIIDLTELIEENAPHYMDAISVDEDTLKAVKTDEGTMLSFFTILRNYTDGPTNGMVIRQDWLDEVGMDIPKTYDQLHDALLAFKNTYNCRYPLYFTEHAAYEYASLQAGYGMTCFINTEGDGVVYPFFQVDGEIKFGPAEEGFKDYVTMMNGWYNEGLLSEDFASLSGAPFDSNFSAAATQDQAGVFNCDIDTWEEFSAMAENPNYELAAMADVGITEDQMMDLGFRTRNYKTAGASISSDCKNPELAVKWLDFFYSDEGSMLNTYGVEDVSFTYDTDGNPQWTELITNNPDGLTMAQAVAKYLTTNDGLVYSLVSTTAKMTDVQQQAILTWASRCTSKGDLPRNLTLSTEESELFYDNMMDLVQYCQEMIPKFITGDAPLSELDAFQNQLWDMGLQVGIDCYQGALDRYNAR